MFAIQGLLANTPAAERFQGLQKALKENPGVELVQWVAGDWDRTKAYNQTREMLIAHPDINGVWCANDDMAMGAIQALKEAEPRRKGHGDGNGRDPRAVRRHQGRHRRRHRHERREVSVGARARHVAGRKAGQARRRRPARRSIASSRSRQ